MTESRLSLLTTEWRTVKNRRRGMENKGWKLKARQTSQRQNQMTTIKQKKNEGKTTERRRFQLSQLPYSKSPFIKSQPLWLARWRTRTCARASECISTRSSFQKYSAANTKLAKLTNVEVASVYGSPSARFTGINKNITLPLQVFHLRCQEHTPWTGVPNRTTRSHASNRTTTTENRKTAPSRLLAGVLGCL